MSRPRACHTLSVKSDYEPSLNGSTPGLLRRSTDEVTLSPHPFMTELVTSVADTIDRAVQRVTPLAYRLRRRSRRLLRRALRRPRSVSEGPNLLPLLIQVLASFSKADGVLLEEEIDSSLGFLRYDYPEAVYSELRKLFRQALYEQQNLAAMAQKLAVQLSTERKIMLGVQLYDLISQAGLKQEQVVAFYSFMSQLGMAAQAIDIVYQLNASEDSDPSIFQRGASPLESVSFGNNGASDVMLKSLERNGSVARISLSRSDSAQELQRSGRLCSRAPAGARRILSNLSGSTHPHRRSGADLSGTGDLFQRQEKRFHAANFHPREQGFG